MDLISVIVPAYNAENSIERCLSSICGGGYDNIEIIVVNDGSTDKTDEIVASFEKRDSRVRLLNKANGGVGSARNTGLKAASGKYIAWCDSDDWVEPDWLENLHDNLIKYDADISICRAQIDGREPYPNPDMVEIWEKNELLPRFIEHNSLNGTLWNKLCKKDILEGVEFNEELRYWEDLDFLWRVLKRTDRIVRMHKETYHFVVHEGSLCSSRINQERLDATAFVWGQIVSDCKCINNEIYQAAILKKCMWDYGGLKLMFRDEYRDTATEQKIQQEIKMYQKQLFKKVESKTDRLFMIVTIVSISLARSLYKVLRR